MNHKPENLSTHEIATAASGRLDAWDIRFEELLRMAAERNVAWNGGEIASYSFGEFIAALERDLLFAESVRVGFIIALGRACVRISRELPDERPKGT